MSSFTSALTRLRTANHPLGGIWLGRSASLAAASALSRSGTSLPYSPAAGGELLASGRTSWAFWVALSASS